MLHRVALFLLLLTTISARADLEGLSLNGQDYVTLESLATTYGMVAPSSRGSGEFTASGNGHSIVVKTGSRQAIVDGVRQWLSYPAAARGSSAAVSRVDVVKTIGPAINPTEVKGFKPFNTVVLDPGHGGYDRGARSSYGFEKDFALDVTQRVRKRLEKAGLKVVQTRMSDVFIPLESRPAVARKYPNSIFVSIHFNSGESNPAANGLEIFAISPLGAPPTGQSRTMDRDRQREAGHALEPVNTVMANTIYNSLIGKMPSFDRGVKRARFVVLKDATVPAVLIEGGFLTNAAEAAKIGSTAWRETYADAIATGILEYRKLAEQGTAPRRAAAFGRGPTTQLVPER